jgi:hypothetical protein
VQSPCRASRQGPFPISWRRPARSQPPPSAIAGAAACPPGPLRGRSLSRRLSRPTAFRGPTGGVEFSAAPVWAARSKPR